MKRRQAIRSILTWPAVAALPAAGQQNESAPAKAPSTDQNPELILTSANAAAAPAPQFFSAPELAALRRLSEILVPPFDGRPGAGEAGAAEFLDFLISQSANDRRVLFREGIAHLEFESHRLYRKPFGHLSAAEADPLLAPLRQPWLDPTPSDPFARFLLSVKEDALRATVNSRQWAAAATGRRGSGMGVYWYALD
jgi:hypothetical protein